MQQESQAALDEVQIVIPEGMQVESHKLPIPLDDTDEPAENEQQSSEQVEQKLADDDQMVEVDAGE